MYIFLTVFAVFSLFPFFWMLVTALKPVGEGLSLSIIPSEPTLENFKRILTEYNFLRYFVNSLIVATSAGLFSTIFAFLAAYTFAKRKFAFKKTLMGIFLSAMMVPGMVYLVPQFAIVNKLGWMNTYQAMVVPHLANAFGFFLLAQYIRTIPNSLIEAARVDGAGELTIISLVLSVTACAFFSVGSSYFG